MPPRIYKSGIRAINPPSGRPYELIGNGGLVVEFLQPQIYFNAGNSSLSVEFKGFEFSSNAIYSLFSPEFNSFEFYSEAKVGGIGSFNVEFTSPLTIFGSNEIVLDSTSFDLGLTGTILQSISIVCDISPIHFDLYGEIPASITIVVPPSKPESDNFFADTFSGDLYIVLNLKTKTHTTYRDGSTNALAQTGEIVFGSNHTKNVSEVYLNSRGTDKLKLIVKNAEDTERTYQASYPPDSGPNLKNKKFKIAKGLKGTNWQFTITSSPEGHLELRELEMLVNEFKRWV